VSEDTGRIGKRADDNNSLRLDDIGQGHGRIRGEYEPLTADQKRLVEKHIGLVGIHLRHKVAMSRLTRKDREYDDLFQEGCLALIKTSVGYDAARHGEFAAYALPRIRAAVFRALCEKFSMIYVPMNERIRMAKQKSQGIDPVACPILGLKSAMGVEQPEKLHFNQDEETIGHEIHRRYELAIDKALEQMRLKKWRRRNPYSIMERIARERLLIGKENAKTPLRQIARESGISSGRASAYERQLVEEVDHFLRNDHFLPVLVGFAGEDPNGFDGLMNEHRREALKEAQIRSFVDRFDGLDRSARAELLYSLIERSVEKVTDVARNLYKMTMVEDGLALHVTI